MEKGWRVMSKTKKPCPGCNQVTSYWRAADEVCGDCKRAIRDGKRYAEMVKRTAERDTGKSLWGYPTLASQWGSGPRSSRREESGFHESLCRVIEECGIPTEKTAKKGIAPLDNRTFFQSAVLMSDTLAVLLGTLADSADKMAEMAYAKGRRRGESLVASLAEGRTTIMDWNERTIGANDDY